MKTIILIFIISIASLTIYAQNFTTDIASAKSSYSAGKLEDAHFKLEQLLQQLDITIGKEVLKMLPENMDTMRFVAKDDNVMGNVGFLGATIQRRYGMGERNAEVQIINNSPTIGALNALLNMPMMGGMGGDGKTKIIKIQGYKARLTIDDSNENNTKSYKLEVPLSNALITLDVKNSTETEIMNMANTLPMEKIAQMIE